MKSLLLSIVLLGCLSAPALATVTHRGTVAGTRATNINNQYYFSPDSPIPGINPNPTTTGIEARFRSGVSLAGLTYPTPNLSYAGGTESVLTAQFASYQGAYTALTIGVQKAVKPGVSGWYCGSNGPGSIPLTNPTFKQGYFIRLTMANGVVCENDLSISAPSSQAGTWHQVRIQRAATGWNVTVWDSTTAQNLLNTTVGEITALGANGQFYTPTRIHNGWLGHAITSSDPALTPSNTARNYGLQFERAITYQGNTVNFLFPNRFPMYTQGWLGSQLQFEPEPVPVVNPQWTWGNRFF